MRKTLFLSVLLALTLMVSAQEAKYVFYFIGDGMGPNQVLGTEMYLAEKAGRIGYEQLLFTQFPVSGMARTYSSSNGITDSAAAGTALAAGKKTKNSAVGVDPKKQPVNSIAKQLKDKGRAVAICTSVSIDHATPACFYAHEPNRKSYYKIGQQLPESGFDFFAGAGFRKPLDANNPSKPSLYSKAESAGYTIAHGIAEFDSLKSVAKKMILVQEKDGLKKNNYKSKESIPYEIDREEGDLTLAQITRAALEFTPKQHGFFMMIEGGMIDWGCHNNDALAAFHEVIEMDEAIKIAYQFYQEHPDSTLIVITADHETGGLSLGRDGDYTLNLQSIDVQQRSGELAAKKIKGLYKKSIKEPEDGKKKPLPYTWDDVKEDLGNYFGFFKSVELTSEEENALKNCWYKMCEQEKNIVPTSFGEEYDFGVISTRILNKRAQIAWTTGGHTAANVPVFAIGVGAEQFRGWQDNTTIPEKILQLATPKQRPVVVEEKVEPTVIIEE